MLMESMADGIRQLMWSGCCGCWSERRGKKRAGEKGDGEKGDGGYFIWARGSFLLRKNYSSGPNKISSVPFFPVPFFPVPFFPRPFLPSYLIHLKQARRTHAAADAHSAYNKFGTASLAFDQGVTDHACTTHAVGVPD